jgi:5-methyltetrahydropteroyltriglutamate--homocysteine methyltransferase
VVHTFDRTVKRSEDRILTSHAGALHMPADLADLVVAEWMGEPHDGDALEVRLNEAVTDVVQRQADLGIDVVSDGEFSKSSWMGYVVERLSGIELRPEGTDWYDAKGKVSESKEYHDFQGFYAEAGDQMTYFEPGAERRGREWVMKREAICVGPVKYTGQDALQRDIENLKAALARAGLDEGFLPVVAPGSAQPWIKNEHYRDDESFFADLAAALKQEYQAIVNAGLICQIDDAMLVGEWDRRLMDPDWDLDRYRAWAALAVEAVNAALDGIPADRVRYHVCWGSSNRPHTTDIPLPDIVDLILRVNAQTFLIEAANARHEWEFRVWENVQLPDDKILMPGVIEHATHVVEHPQTVAERIIRFANRVGRENVIAGTDCGFRGRSHPQVAWAKLKALAEGAELASQRLW